MAYILPEDVRSPISSWRLERVLENEGESPPEGNGAAKHSLAMGYWEGTKCIAIRWNGYEGKPNGNPTAFGMHPTWFILPSSFNNLIFPLIKISLWPAVVEFLEIENRIEPNRVGFPPGKS